MLWNALKFGSLALVVVPLVLALGAYGVAQLAGSCGAGSSGGCEMGAATIFMVTLIPAFVVGAGISVVRDLVRRRS